jgi:hypothetical protein
LTLPTGTFVEAGAGTIAADRGANARLKVGELRAEAVLVSGHFLFKAEGDPLSEIEAEWLAVDAGSAARAARCPRPRQRPLRERGRARSARLGCKRSL